jgi:molybdopterin converting factor small subunit
MRVRVKLFASLRELAGTGDLETVVEPGATVADVWAALVSRYPALAPYAAATSCARNLEYARLSTPVDPDDEIAFMPPVSGGEAV